MRDVGDSGHTGSLRDILGDDADVITGATGHHGQRSSLRDILGDLDDPFLNPSGRHGHQHPSREPFQQPFPPPSPHHQTSYGHPHPIDPYPIHPRPRSSQRDQHLERIDCGPCHVSNRPRLASAFPLYEPGNSAGPHRPPAPGHPLDLVFVLRDPLDGPTPRRTLPRRLEVRIPVNFRPASSAAQPTSEPGEDAYPEDVDPQLPGLLSTPGSAAAPKLPTVEALGRGARWMYSVKLVVGNVYPDTTKMRPGSRVESETYVGDWSREGEEKVMALLVVTVVSTLGKAKMAEHGRDLDASFLLKGVWLGAQATHMAEEKLKGQWSVNYNVWSEACNGDRAVRSVPCRFWASADSA